MHRLHVYASHIYRLIPPSSIECHFISISDGLEIEGLVEIGVKVRFHPRRKERLILGAWSNHVACVRKYGIGLCYMHWLMSRPQDVRKGISTLSRVLNRIVG
jgi:hypothetical protein